MSYDAARNSRCGARGDDAGQDFFSNLAGLPSTALIATQGGAYYGRYAQAADANSEWWRWGPWLHSPVCNQGRREGGLRQEVDGASEPQELGSASRRGQAQGRDE